MNAIAYFAQVMQPIRTAADALERTWKFPAVFELRKNTDDWADEAAAEDAFDGHIHHGLDMDFDALRRFKQHFRIPKNKYVAFCAPFLHACSPGTTLSLRLLQPLLGQTRGQA